MIDFECEKNIIGGILINNDIFDSVNKIITASDFAKGFNQEVYREIKRFLDGGQPVNIQILYGLPKFKKHASEIVAYTSDAISVNTVYHAKKLKELAIKRTIQGLSEQMQEYVKSSDTDCKKIIEDIETTLNDIVVDKNQNVYKPVKDFVQLAIKKIQLDYDTKGVPGVRTGFSHLDNMIGGFQNQELIILGARPSIGKTALALNIAEHVVKNQKAVGFLSLEMSGTLLIQRLLCGNSDISQTDIRKGHLSEIQMTELRDSASKIYEYPLFIYDYPNADLSDLKAKARLMKRVEKIQMLFIDYLGLIKLEGKMPRWEKVGIISAELKALSRELDIPVVVLSQVGRQAEDKAPTLADLRDSGSIEQDADIVMFLHRKRDEPETELHVAKNRNGLTGLIKMAFASKSTTFREVTDKYDDLENNIKSYEKGV